MISRGDGRCFYGITIGALHAGGKTYELLAWLAGARGSCFPGCGSAGRFAVAAMRTNWFPKYTCFLALGNLPANTCKIHM